MNHRGAGNQQKQALKAMEDPGTSVIHGYVDFLTSPKGIRACEFAELFEGSELAMLERLRAADNPNQLTAGQAAAVAKTVDLRRKAAGRFALAHKMLFTDEGLQQSTSQAVAEYTARRFSGFSAVLDICCGIGGDTIELAKACDRVIAVDIDPVKAAIARHNVAVHGLSDKVEIYAADGTVEDFLNTTGRAAQAVYVDPSRRSAGKRFISLEDYSPPRDRIMNLVNRFGNVAVKCAPAIDYEQYLDQAAAEVISLNGECKQVILWFGGLSTARVQATVLPAKQTLTHAAGEVPVKPPGKYIFEPDSAVIRAHLVEDLAAKFDLWKLDDTIAYLSGDHSVKDPLLTCKPIIDWLPFNIKKLKATLRSLGINNVDIKRRGFPMSPEELRKKVNPGKQRKKASGGASSAVLYCTRHAGKRIIIIGGG